MVRPSLPLRLVPPIATIKVVLGLAAFCAVFGHAQRISAFPYVFYALLPIAFGATGALLLLGGRGDRRALALGGFFLVTAASWSDAPLKSLGATHPGWEQDFLCFARAVQPQVFLAFFLWAFARDFPTPSPHRRRFRLLMQVSAWAGVLLFALNLLSFALQRIFTADGLVLLEARDPSGLCYLVVVFLALPAFVLLPWKARTVRGPEQRRARVFLEILALTFGPMFLFLAIYLPTPFLHHYLPAHPRLLFDLVVAVLLPALTLPFTVPYAVLVQRVLDVRLIARRALQYLLARSMVTALVAVPSAALLVYVYVFRHKAITDLFAGPRVPLLVAAVLTGAAALRYRKPLLDAIDRRFFRERFDARHILTLLVERIRSIRDSTHLANLVTREIDLALHLEGISMLTLDGRSGLLIDPRNRTRRLDSSSALTIMLSNESAPLLVDLKNPQSPLRKLPERDRQWLREGGFHLLVPILARDGSLLGLLGLGEKKSGLPFLKEDRQLLHAIASSGAWVLELEVEMVFPSRPPGGGVMEPEDPTPRELPPPPPTERAKECPKCGELHPGYTVFCRECSRRLEPAVVPYVLPGKFRFERRIGTGGMGVVYSGFDLALGRRVAIKTLREASPDDVLRLRREARTAAAVSQPNLAPVYGLETWQGTPLLVMELLEGGTLAQRVAREKLTPGEVVELGIAMAGALAQLHAADILHRDIKPSNIGYTRDRVPKLMDFGIARVRLEIDDEEEERSTEDLERAEDDTSTELWAEDGGPELPRQFRFAGTLSYLSPEALRREAPDATFDLWGLAIVLYECLLGRKVFAGNQQQVMARIRSGMVPDFSQVCPDHDEALGDFFRSALHRSADRRPATAEALRERLETVRARLERDLP
jgi:tRNA A-37 threonylcarbamoyl transferase component Bud32